MNAEFNQAAMKHFEGLEGVELVDERPTIIVTCFDIDRKFLARFAEPMNWHNVQLWPAVEFSSPLGFEIYFSTHRQRLGVMLEMIQDNLQEEVQGMLQYPFVDAGYDVVKAMLAAQEFVLEGMLARADEQLGRAIESRGKTLGLKVVTWGEVGPLGLELNLKTLDRPTLDKIAAPIRLGKKAYFPQLYGWQFVAYPSVSLEWGNFATDAPVIEGFKEHLVDSYDEAIKSFEHSLNNFREFDPDKVAKEKAAINDLLVELRCVRQFAEEE